MATNLVLHQRVQNPWKRSKKVGVKGIGKNKIEALAGTTFQRSIQKGLTFRAAGYSSDDLIGNLSAAPVVDILKDLYTQYSYNAFFLRINYNRKDKYFINATGRRDGSSRFGPGMQFSNFGAIGTAWIFSNERIFAEKLRFLSFGRLRASYGTSGSDQIGDYEFMGSFSSSNSSYNGVTGLIPTRMVNPTYSWEGKRKLEAALKLGFMNGRIMMETSWYRNRASNQLIGVELPAYVGFPSQVQSNEPVTVQNTGWEFTLNTAIISGNSFKWYSSVNLTVPKNKLVEYPDLKKSSYANELAIGEPLTIVRNFKQTGVDPYTGQYTFAGTNPATDLIVSSDAEGQKFFGGIGNVLSWRGWSLDAYFQFVKQNGFNYLNSFYAPGRRVNNQPTLVMTRWQNPGDVSEIQQFSQNANGPAGISYATASTHGEARVSDASFIRLKNITLTYQMPGTWVERIGLQHATIFAQGQNPLTITRYLGSDPETQNTRVLPPLRVVTIGLQITL